MKEKTQISNMGGEEACVFAAAIMAEMAHGSGCLHGQKEILGGILAVRGLLEGETNLAPPLYAKVGRDRFFAEERCVGIEVGNKWRLEYEHGTGSGDHKVTAKQRAEDGEWAVQDTPGGGAGVVFFRKGEDGGFYVSRKIHFFMGALWDPVDGKPSDSGYTQDGRVAWARSFRNGIPSTQESEARPLRGMRTSTRPEKTHKAPGGFGGRA